VAAVSQCLAAWLLDRGEVPDEASIDSAASRLRDRLLLSNGEMEGLVATLRSRSALERWGAMSVAQRKRAAASASFAAAAGLLTEGAERDLAARIAEDVWELKGTASGLAPAPLITGDDLVAAGWAPGPRFGRVLEAVYDAQLEDRVGSREEAMELARTLGVEPP
jgi:poly(A) polymerase